MVRQDIRGLFYKKNMTSIDINYLLCRGHATQVGYNPTPECSWKILLGSQIFWIQENSSNNIHPWDLAYTEVSSGPLKIDQSEGAIWLYDIEKRENTSSLIWYTSLITYRYNSRLLVRLTVTDVRETSKYRVAPVDTVCVVTTFGRLDANRAWLPVMLVVSWTVDNSK